MAVKTNTKPSKIKPPVEKSQKIFKCVTCGNEYTKQESNFQASRSDIYAGNNHYLPTCKHCVDKLVEHYTEALGNEDDAIRRTCMKFDIYYSKVLVEACKKISENRSKMLAYVSRSNLQQYQGKTYDTTLDEENNGAINSLEDFEDKNKTSEARVSEKSIKIWGFGFTPEDYISLNNQYDDWKAKVVIEGKPKESLVRELCIIKLQQGKALVSKDIELYDKLTKTYQSTLANANLSPLKEAANDKAGEIPMGMMYLRFENDRPIPEPLPEWADVDGIMRLITIYFLGHLCKMLGLKNKYAKMYEDEMQRYRVTIPELEDYEDEEDIFDFLANNGLPDSVGDYNGFKK